VAHRSSYVLVTGGESFLGGKEGMRLNSHLHPVWRLKCVELHFDQHISLHDMHNT